MAEGHGPYASDRSAGSVLLAVCLALLGWAGLAAVLARPDLLPSPWAVLAWLIQAAASGTLWPPLAITLAHVLLAWGLALGLAVVCGLRMGQSARFSRWVGPWLDMVSRVPVALAGLLCAFWAPWIAPLAVALPMVGKLAPGIRAARRGLDQDVLDMARLYQMTGAAVSRHVIWPQLAPHVWCAARSGFRRACGGILVVEALVADGGIGGQMARAVTAAQPEALLGLAAAFGLVALTVDGGLLRGRVRQAGHWRAA